MNFPLPKPLLPWAVVEITADSTAEDRSGLILAAYRASRAGVVGLALRGVAPRAVDHVLNTVVDARRSDLKGVIYLDPNNEPALLAAAAQARLVIASSERLRESLRERGIPVVDARDAGRYLEAFPGGQAASPLA